MEGCTPSWYQAELAAVADGERKQGKPQPSRSSQSRKQGYCKGFEKSTVLLIGLIYSPTHQLLSINHVLNNMIVLNDLSEVECLKVACNPLSSQPVTRKAVCKAPNAPG